MTEQAAKEEFRNKPTLAERFSLRNLGTFFGGWFLFVFFPILAFHWAGERGLSLLRRNSIQEASFLLVQETRKILGCCSEENFCRKRFKESPTNPLSSPAFEYRLSWPGCSDKAPLFDLACFLDKKNSPTSEQVRSWHDLLGNGFDPELVRKSQGFPFSEQWGKQTAWFIWKRNSLVNPPILSLGVFVPPPLRERIAKVISQPSTLPEIVPSLYELRGSDFVQLAGQAPPRARQRLEQFRESKSKVISGSEEVGYFEYLGGGLILYLERSLPFNARETRNRDLYWISLCGLFTLSILFRNAWKNFSSWPLSAKFNWLFLILYGIPLVAAVFLAWGYLEDGRLSNILELLQTARRELMNFDDAYLAEESRTERLALQLRQDRDLATANFAPFRRRVAPLIRRGDLDRLEVRDWNSKQLFVISRGKDDSGVESFNRLLCQAVLEETLEGYSGNKQSFDPVRIAFQTIVVEPTMGLVEVIRWPNTLMRFRFGNSYFWWFWSRWSGPETPVAFLNMTRSHHIAALHFLSKNLLKNRPVRIFVKDRQTGRWFPRSPHLSGIENFCQDLQQLGESQIGRFQSNGRAWFALGLPGQRLEQFDLVALIPDTLLESSMKTRQEWVGIGLLLLLGVGFCVIWLARESLLVPIQGISQGIKALKARDFEFRVQHNVSDELGQMSFAFNRMIDSISELNIAKVVQEKLLPQKFEPPAGYEIAMAHNMFPHLGGGYMDLFTLKDGSLGFLVGDVSGQGVGAALVMAMVKTLIFLQVQEGWDTEKSLPKIHEDLLDLTQKQNFFCLCLGILDPKRHEGNLFLAGNPFPMLFRAESSKVSFQGNPAYPLASRQKIACTPLKFSLNPGDLLLLYSDGVVKILNSQNQPFGYDRLQRCLEESEDLSPKEILEKIRQVLANHAVGHRFDVDITLLALRRTPITLTEILTP
ncbi:MAG: SpoIIE family protein phosphatase [Candidatus Riflebacteria bacterium]|nr:SpoIIE family protein phosphatase [Candidatus Riflebacteria bacterium]